MKSADQLIKLYSGSLLPMLHDLEPARKALLPLFWSGIAALAASVPGIVWYLRSGQLIYLLAVLPLVVCGLYQLYRFSKKRQIYADEFKNCVIRQLIALIDPKLEYFPERHIGEADYRESGLFRQRIDRFNGDDLVEGAFGATGFCFSALKHEEKRDTSASKGGARARWVTVFNGIFFIADFNKHFVGRTYVVPDAHGSFLRLGKLFEKSSFGRGELVELENPEFESLFTVYGSDQVEARYILSPSLMERLIRFRRKANTRVHISFIHSKLFVALTVDKDPFEPRVFSSGVQLNYLQDYFRYLDLVTGIIDDLNLNLRIWGKV